MSVSRGTSPNFEPFIDCLIRWSARINLVADAAPGVIRERHIADSLRLIPLLPINDAPCADIGSGAGFPGLILAAATGRRFVLIEVDQRKAAFLHEAARLLEANVEIRAVRAETCAGLGAAAVTARAVAPLPRLLGLCAPLLRPSGVLLAPKGMRAEQELTAARLNWHCHVERFAGQAPGSVIYRISDIEAAHDQRSG